jgi:adenosylcobinamide kinase/adenosylcobinamide-phosphate guanylyltransferase
MSLILITGGARSGKSALAVKLAKESHKKVAFIATAEAYDSEMENRIAKHKAERPEGWATFEAPKHLSETVSVAIKDHDFIIVDCLTLFLSNLLLEIPLEKLELHEEKVLDRVRKFVKVAKDSPATVVVVSNEVGTGIVPENRLARVFRDIAGKANQIAASESNAVYICFSGIPIRLK